MKSMAVARSPCARRMDRQNLAEKVGAGIRETCQLKVDRVEFLASGTLPEGHKKIVDQRGMD